MILACSTVDKSRRTSGSRITTPDRAPPREPPVRPDSVLEISEEFEGVIGCLLLKFLDIFFVYVSPPPPNLIERFLVRFFNLILLLSSGCYRVKVLAHRANGWCQCGFQDVLFVRPAM